ncbi:MAG: HigA family addiction module antidote protein [Muribaculaceae bacterium]|jgi:HTH-type transcriptional regulator/antitoxin HigA|nr:HigA family addiction module antidote protein [Muribaculaceae bacterium]
MNIINPQDYTLSPHPGTVLKGELEEYGLSQRELASALGKSAPMINGIITGSKDITVEIAILLEAALPGSLKASDWLRLQNEHDLEIKRKEIESRTAAIEIWTKLRSHANLNVLKKRLAFSSDFEKNIDMVMEALGISDVQQLERQFSSSAGCFKKSEKVQTEQSNLFTWVIIVRHVSNSITLDTEFNSMRIPELIRKLNAVFYSNTDVIAKTEKLLNSFGIKFIANEKRLDKVPVDGFSFWSGINPTIVSTQRMNRIDNFAFTIMHELGHIMLHLKQDSTHSYIDVDRSIMVNDEKETAANQFATEALWSGNSPIEAFSDIENPYAAANKLKAIARSNRINVGIVTGQYHHFCQERSLVKNSYAICRDLIAKIS